MLTMIVYIETRDQSKRYEIKVHQERDKTLLRRYETTIHRNRDGDKTKIYGIETRHQVSPHSVSRQHFMVSNGFLIQ